MRCSRGKRTKREGERKKTWGGKPQNDKTAEFRVRVTNVYYLILYYLYKTHDDLRLKRKVPDSTNQRRGEKGRGRKMLLCIFFVNRTVCRWKSSVIESSRCEKRLAKLTFETVPDLKNQRKRRISSVILFGEERDVLPSIDLPRLFTLESTCFHTLILPQMMNLMKFTNLGEPRSDGVMSRCESCFKSHSPT